MTSSPVRLHSASVDAARLPEQSFDTVNTAGLTGLLQQEAAVRSAFHTSPHIVPSHPAPCQLCPNSSGMPGARSDHSSELSSEPGRIPLEEGELPDVDEPPQQSQLDEPADEVLLASQQGTAASAAIAISPAPTVKRKRGERAGKRVRQRQARRTRDAHLSLMLTDGAMMLAPQAPKRLCSTKHLPTCKYEVTSLLQFFGALQILRTASAAFALLILNMLLMTADDFAAGSCRTHIM